MRERSRRISDLIRVGYVSRGKAVDVPVHASVTRTINGHYRPLARQGFKLVIVEPLVMLIFGPLEGE